MVRWLRYRARLVERRFGMFVLLPPAVVVLAVTVLAVVFAPAANRHVAAPVRSTSTTSTSTSQASTTASAALPADAGATTTSPPTTTATAATTTTVQRHLENLDGAQFTIGPTGQSAGSPKRCGALAATVDQRARGLMGQTDLGGYDAMVFRFDGNSTAQFYMANVKIQLSVAWFDGNGKFVSSLDMPLCTSTAGKCPYYSATGPYRYAIEVPKGGLGALGATSGSSLSLGGSCT